MKWSKNSLKNNQYTGYFAIITANIIFGINIPVTKALISGWLTPQAYTIIRMIFGCVFFWLIDLRNNNEIPAKKDLLILAFGGLLGFVATQLTFALSLKYTTPVNYALMMALTPVVVLLLSFIFLKEKVNSTKSFGIALSVSGAFIIILKSHYSSSGSNNLLGILIAILCSVCYGIYLLLTRNVSIKYKPLTVVKWMFLFAVAFSFPFGVKGITEQKIFTQLVTMSGVLLLGFSLVFSTVIAFFLMPVALGKLKASVVSIFMNLQPIVASVTAVIVGQDKFTLDKIFAASLVLIGVYIVTKKAAFKVDGINIEN